MLGSLDQTLIVASALSMAALFPLVFVLYLALRSYRRLAERYAQLWEKQESELADSQGEAERILTEAREKAQRIVTEAEVFTDDFSKKFYQSLNEAIGSLGQESTEVMHKVSQDIKSQASEEMGELRKTLEEELKTSQATVRQNIDEELKNVKVEIEKYKQAKFQEAEQNIAAAISDVARRVLQMSIDPKEHKELIIRSLEEAKKEHVL